jgi:FkbM family methyltransferase
MSIRSAVAAAMRSCPFPGRFRVSDLMRRMFGDEELPFDLPIDIYKIRVNAPVFQPMYYTGAVDWNVTHYLWRHIQPGDTVFDLGANIGSVAIAISRKVGSGRIIALEALEANYRELCFNVRRNGISNIVPIFAAITNTTGTLRVPKLAQSGNYSLASDSIDATEIPTWSLDDFCARHGVEQIDLMKIDIEGSETKALRGAYRLFSSGAIRQILIEFNPYWLKKMGSSSTELYDEFDSHRLKVFQLTRFAGVKPTNRSAVHGVCKREGFTNLVVCSPDVAATVFRKL